MQKYYVWAPDREEEVQANFKVKASKLLSSTFSECRKNNRISYFMVPNRWDLLMEHCDIDENFIKRSVIGKMARASEKALCTAVELLA